MTPSVERLVRGLVDLLELLGFWVWMVCLLKL
jgi:hypothetical protein